MNAPKPKPTYSFYPCLCIDSYPNRYKTIEDFHKDQWDAYGYDWDPERPSLIWNITEETLEELKTALEADGIECHVTEIGFRNEP